MGQFSWFTQDTNRQICSTKGYQTKVFMVDNKGIHYPESNYEGYGVFCGKDYYVLLAEMNGFSSDSSNELRTIGIDIEFRNEGRRPVILINPVIYPALVENELDINTHDFGTKSQNDPDQGWADDDDDDWGLEDEDDNNGSDEEYNEEAE